MANFYSYRELLKTHLEKTNPEKILEYGPGESTQIMLDNSDAEIHSIEHNYRWLEEATNRFKDNPRVNLYYIKEEQDYCEKEFPFKFDLIFVDGLCAWRVHCLKSAINMLNENGYVILHDSERTIYDEGRALYDTVIEYDGTALLTPKTITKKTGKTDI